MALPLVGVNVLDLTNIMAGQLKDGDTAPVEQGVLELNELADRFERGFCTHMESSLQ